MKTRSVLSRSALFPRSAASGFALGVFLTATIHAQTTATWNVPSGNWSTPSNWNPNVDPSGVGYNAAFNNGGSLTCNGTRTVNNYSQSGGNFDLVGGNSLLVGVGGGNLTGGGIMTFAGGFLYNATPSPTFSIANGTLRGTGQIGYTALSVSTGAAGIIDANTPGNLILNGSGLFTNQGLYRASGGGSLTIAGSAEVINTGGVIRSASGSLVVIQGSPIFGGTLDNANSTGVIGLSGGTLRDVTITAGSSIETNTSAKFSGTIHNFGTITTTGSYSNIIQSNTTFTGGGTFSLGFGYIHSAYGTPTTLTNLNNTLRGYGQIGYYETNLINASLGTVQADVNGQTFQLTGTGAFTNQGLMRALNGGTLVLSGSQEVENTGTIRSGSGSTVSISSRIHGGSLDNPASAGTMLLAGGSLRDVTITAGSTVETNTSAKFSGTIHNLGIITSSGSNSNIIQSDTTFTGGGIFSLGYGYIHSASGAPTTLTNIDNTLRGYGQIGYYETNVINASLGTIQADVSGQTLQLIGSGIFTNDGLMRAMNGGTLRIAGSQEVENHSVIRAESGSIISIENRIHGGSLDNPASAGTIQLAGGALRDVTITAGSTVGTNNSAKFSGTINNLGSITTTGNNVNVIQSNTIFSGGGTFSLGYGYIYSASGTPTTLTNTNNTLRGYGEIGYYETNVINASQGTVQADVAGQTLQLNGSGVFTNHGLMRAINGGTLRFTGSKEVENTSVVRAESGSTVSIENRIHGGEIGSSGSGSSVILAGGTLRDVTISSGSTVTANSSAKFSGAIQNMGTIGMSGGASNFITTDTTLTGGGTVSLGFAYLYNSGPANTLTNTDNTLRGYGEIGYSAMSLVNSSGGTVQADVAGNTLSLTGGGTFTNQGRFRAVNGGVLFQATAGTFSNYAAGVLTGGTYEVGAGSAFRFNAAAISTNAATIILDGPGSNITNTSNADALTNFTLNQSGASFTLRNNRDFSVGSAFTNNGSLVLGRDSEFTAAGTFTSGSGASLATTISAAPVLGAMPLGKEIRKN